MSDSTIPIDGDELDERFLESLELYETALRFGLPVDEQMLAGLTDTHRSHLETAKLSLQALVASQSAGGSADVGISAAHIPSRIGHYQIERILGAGGFAVVYLARDEFTNRLAAVKVPRPHVLLSAELRERFVREAQAAAQLDHPQIVPVYEAGQDGDVPYIASAFCQGPTLSEWLKDATDPLPPRQAAEIVMLLAGAVQYSHEHGILHRDITPSNVLLVPRTAAHAASIPYLPRLSDFGLAKLLESQSDETASSQLMGTPSYMAPELAQRQRGAAGPEIDVYGLGAVLYFTLTGRAPFVGDSPWETLIQLRELDPVAPHLIRPSVPRDLELICLKAMAKEPVQRYAEAGLLAEDLEHWLGGRPIMARPTPVWRQAWQWCRRYPSVASLSAAVAGAALLLVLGLIGYTLQMRALGKELESNNSQLTDTVLKLDAAVELRAQAQRKAEGHAREYRQTLYAIEIGRAAAAWQRGDVGTMNAALLPYARVASDDEDLRDFSWHYLWQRQAVQEVFRTRVPAHQYTAAFSPDGRSVAFAGADSVVRLYSRDEYELLREIPTGQREVNHVIFDPQGHWLATAGDDGTVAIWNLPDGSHRASWPVFVNVPAFQLAYSGSTEELIVAGNNPEVKILDQATGEVRGVLADGHSSAVEALALSPDERILVTCGHDKSAIIWDLAARRIRHRLKDFTYAVSSAAWTPDGRYVAIGALDGLLRIWDDAAGRVVANRRMIDPVQSLAYLPGGVLLVGDRSGAVSVLKGDFAPTEEEQQLTPVAHWALHKHRVYGMAVSREGNLFATASRDQEVAVFTPQIAPRVERHEPLKRPERYGPSSIVGPDSRGRTFRRAERGIAVFAAGATSEPTFLSPETEFTHISLVEDTLLACTFVGRLHQWNVSEAITSPSVVQVFDSSPLHRVIPLDADRVLIQQGVMEVGLWSLKSKRMERLWTGRHNAAVSPDHRYFALASNIGHRTELYDAANLRLLWAVDGHTEPIRAMVFGNTKPYLYTASSDRTIRIRELATGKEIRQLRGHETYIRSIALSPDERTLASCDDSGSLRLWDLRTGRELFELYRHYDAPLEWLEFTPDGKELLGTDQFLVEFRWSAEPVHPAVKD